VLVGVDIARSTDKHILNFEFEGGWEFIVGGVENNWVRSDGGLCPTAFAVRGCQGSDGLTLNSEDADRRIET